MSNLALAAAIEGFLLGAGLIIAIGSQNAFVLRQGLTGRHIFAVVIVCSLSDALLIAAGVAGLGRLVHGASNLLTFITLGGAIFLLVYGAFAFRRAMRPQGLVAADAGEVGLAGTLATCLALTFLNPHVYLDTLVLIGALSARYDADIAVAFGVGAVLASFVWFFGLGYGASLLRPFFARPGAWRALDIAIGLIMWLIAARLVMEVLEMNS
jgi:L-lysine exporter family protein LysE/ArgO